MPAQHEERTYAVEVVDQNIEAGKFGDQIVLRIQVEETGHERTCWLGLTDENGNEAKYAEKTLEVIRHLGFTDTRITRLHPDHPEHYSLSGAKCDAFCKVKVKDNGDTGERWYLNVPFENNAAPVTKDSMRKLDAMFGKRLTDMGGVKAPKPKPAPEPEPEGHPLAEQDPMEEKPSGGADIPF